MRWIWLVVFLCLGVAQADVVHLTTGRSISGKVIRESETEVVVRTPDGKLTLPRKLVARIDRQTDEQTWLELARDHDRAGSFDRARELYQRAAASDDPRVAELAQAELERFDRRRASAQTYRDQPRTPWALPEGTKGDPVEGDSLQEQFDRARKALEDGTPQRAKRLLEPLHEDNPEDPTLAYLYGRALELLGDDAAARPLYSKALGKTSRGRRGTAWLGELTRRALSGETLGPESRGVGTAWSRASSKQIVVYHRLRQAPAWLTADADLALQRGLERLEVRLRELRLAGHVQVFLLRENDYRFAAGSGRVATHGSYQVAPDGFLVQLYAPPDRDSYRQTLQHELGHLVAFEVSHELPAWCYEGAAAYSESDDARRAYRERVAKRHDALPSLEAMLAGQASAEGVSEDFVAQAAVLFEALASLKEGPRKVFKLAKLLGEEGVEETLRMFKLDLAQVEAAYRRIAGL